MKKENDYLLFGVVVTAIFAIMLFLSYLTPICIDDYWFLEYTSPNVAKMWESALFFYKTHTGRMLSQFLWLFSLAYNPWVYNILNALIFTFFSVLIYKYIFSVISGKKFNYSVMLGIFLSLWLFTPTFGGIYLWRSASCSYLWVIIFSLSIGYFYFAEIFGKEKIVGNKTSHIFLKSIGMFVLGVLGGCSHEEISATLCFGIFTYCIYHVIKRERIPIVKVFGIAGIALGAAILILDPANYVRAGSVVESNSFIMKYAYRIARETFWALRYLTIPFGTACVLLWIISVKQGGKNIKQSIKNNPAVYYLLMLTFFSVYIMTFSAGFALRIFITPVALLTITLGIEIKSMTEECAILGSGFKLFICVVGVACAVEIFAAAYTTHATGQLIYRDTIYDSAEQDNLFSR